jgi:hypothetical protein
MLLNAVTDSGFWTSSLRDASTFDPRFGYQVISAGFTQDNAYRLRVLNRESRLRSRSSITEGTLRHQVSRHQAPTNKC